jgi:DNA-binding NarL/FixJ family response regulator
MDRRSRPNYLRVLAPGMAAPSATELASTDAENSDAEAGMSGIGVLVADGQALVRAGYRVLLKSDERVEVVGEAGSGEEAVTLAGQTQPDVILLDVGLPGLEHCDGIVRVVSHPFLVEAAVMVMTPSVADERVFAALTAGAVGVLVRDAEPGELRHAVRMLARGHAVLPVGLFDRLIDELPPRVRARAPGGEALRDLTGREREVVALVVKGLTNDEIAEHLVISPVTAKKHVSRAMSKLRARHRAELVVLAFQTGLVLPPVPAVGPPRRLMVVN